MKNVIILSILILTLFSCSNTMKNTVQTTRDLVDTVGFANSATKMEQVLDRIQQNFGKLLQEKRKAANITDKVDWKTVICPHDDYAYASYMYPLALQNIKAKTVIMFGVAHKAKNFNLENKLIFDSYPQWKSAYGNVKISSLRESLIKKLDTNSYVVHDSMQAVEHSLEAIIPFLQHYNREVEIVPVLVPYMPFEKMNELAQNFSDALYSIVKEQNQNWGSDFAILISTDAVHYGDQNWGDADYAFMGADSAGYEKAVAHEHEIIDSCLSGRLNPDRIKLFTEYTVEKNDFRQYKWTWCGRYSVPLGLLVSYDLGQKERIELTGQFLDYSTSIAGKNLDLTDIGMGVTAVANIHHWVGYAALGYK